MAVQEIEGVETILFNSIQHDKFGTDVLALTQNQPLLKNKLLKLTPFLDKRGIMRIGGRLSKADIQSSTNHQPSIYTSWQTSCSAAAY